MRKFAAKELTGQEEDRAQLLGWLMVQGSMFGECDLVTQSYYWRSSWAKIRKSPPADQSGTCEAQALKLEGLCRRSV